MRLLFTRLALAPIILAVAAGPARAQEETPDKSGYSLLNPTPREHWRPLSADRPDFTESPYTVDAGAMQLEMSFAEYAKNGDVDAWAVAPANPNESPAYVNWVQHKTYK